MTSDVFAAVVAEIKRQMVAGGQDDNVLQVDDQYLKIKLPLPDNRWMGVEFERIAMPAGPHATRLFAESVLRAYRDGEADAMSEKIEPALSEEEWAHFRDRFQMYEEMETPDMYKFEGYVGAQGVAVHNATLDDADPRKITRAWVEELRSLARSCEESTEPWPTTPESLHEWADALESYLPPEK